MRPARNRRIPDQRLRGAAMPEYVLILAAFVLASLGGARALEAGADKNTNDAAESIGRMCNVDIYLDCVDASFATTTTASATTTTLGGGGSSTTSTTTTSTTSSTIPASTTSTTTSSTIPASTTSTTTSSTIPASTTSTTSTTTSTTTTSTTTSTTTTTTTPVEYSSLEVQKRPRLLSGGLWKPRARFTVWDASNNTVTGATITATITYLRGDGSTHTTETRSCTTATRCNIAGLAVSRDITTQWQIAVTATPEWDGSNASFSMDWEGA